MIWYLDGGPPSYLVCSSGFPFLCSRPFVLTLYGLEVDAYLLAIDRGELEAAA